MYKPIPELERDDERHQSNLIAEHLLGTGDNCDTPIQVVKFFFS
jgi:hypothetical protein